MSFIAMALATVLGVALGLMQISLLWPVRAPSRFVTGLMRNSPWLVILFVIMYVLPSNFRLPGGIRVTNPDWLKATIAFALPTMGNISEIVRGAVRQSRSDNGIPPKVSHSHAFRHCVMSFFRNASDVHCHRG